MIFIPVLMGSTVAPMATEPAAAVGVATSRSPADAGGKVGRVNSVALDGVGGRVGASVVVVVVVVVEGATVEAKSTNGGRAKSSSEEEPASAGNTTITFSS